MATMAFDTLRYSRRLREAGVPESQAEVQAELMAEAFGFYADNLLTKDHFTDVLNARFAEQDARIAAAFASQNARFDKQDERFARQDARFEKQDERFDRQDERFEKQDARFDKQDERFARQDDRFAAIELRVARMDGRLVLHTWMLGVMTVVLVVPQLRDWLT